MVYRFYFSDMIATLPETALTIHYHFCDRKYEVTEDLNRFRSQNRAGRFLDLVCAGPLLRQEAEPELYDCFKFIVTLAQHWAPLVLSEGDRYMLCHASTLIIHLSTEHTCHVAPPRHRNDDQSLCRKVRRGSWDSGSSRTSSVLARRERTRIARPRSDPWSGPDQRTPCTSIDRLDALFDAFGFGISNNLRLFGIAISDTGFDTRRHGGAIAPQLDPTTFKTMLDHIKARVRVKPNTCVACLQFDQRTGNLLPRQWILEFLSEIQ